MEKNKLDEAVNDIEKLKETAEKAAENSEDVKEGKCTAEDEKNELGYILYQNIANTNIQILQHPEVSKAFNNIADLTSEEVSQNLVTLIAIVMTQSAYQAILFYDDMLKAELSKQFDNITNAINGLGADNVGIQSAITIFKQKIGNIEKSLKIEETLKSMHDDDSHPQ